MRKKICLFLAVMITGTLCMAPVQAVTYYGEYCTGGAECACWDYNDLDPTSWYHVGVDFVICSGYMTGYGSHVFAPSDGVTRAQLVQILYNMEGRPRQGQGYSFVDVDKGDWYYDAFRWAFSNQILTPNSPGVFNPKRAATRQEAVKLLYDYAVFKGRYATAFSFMSDYRDTASISGEAYTAVSWAVAAGILTGDEEGYLDPAGPVSRAQWAVMLQRFCEGKQG